MVCVREVVKADDFNPEKAISDIRIERRGIVDESILDKIRSHQNPIAPPPNMKLFSERIEEVGDMRHFLYNKFSGPINIIHIDSGYLWDHLDEEQTELYKSDNVVSGYTYPHDPGLFYAKNSDDSLDRHKWVSVREEIMDSLYNILYWMKFTELTGIEPDMNLIGSTRTLYKLIQDHRDELMCDYKIIAPSDLYI